MLGHYYMDGKFIDESFKYILPLGGVNENSISRY